MVKGWLRLAAVAAPLIVLGVVAGCGGSRRVTVSHRATADLLVHSRWHSKPGASPRIEIVSGALGSDPKQGVVLFESKLSGPSLFTPSGGHGPLRLVAAGPSHWLFRSRDGWTSTLDFDGLYARYYDLGRRLDPTRLPSLPEHGVAIPIAYGAKQQHAILLVGDNVGEWSLYGYVPGFGLPATTDPGDTLRRALLGPHGVLYRIDPSTRRLDRVGDGGKPARFRVGPGPSCTTWPQRDGSRYVACPATIRHISNGGASRTVFTGPRSSTITITWPFLAASPDERTLLLEEDESSCGTHESSYFLALGSGVLIPAIAGPIGPQAQVASQVFDSQPLGWLPERNPQHALVAGLGAGPGDCADEAVGVYDVYPAEGAYLVAATNIGDATTW